jgi:PAS domain S-box-containing protein
MGELRSNEKSLAPEGHPIHILMEEHKTLLQFAGKAKGIAQKLREANGIDSASLEQLKHLEENFKESASHYVREENVLFPYLEKHGITQPPAIMWMEHDQIREAERAFYSLVAKCESIDFQDFQPLDEVASSLAELLANHFAKENSVLFPAALRVIAEDEWRDTKQQFDSLGYCSFTPEAARVPLEEKVVQTPKPEAVEGRVAFETGALSREELESVLNALPVDITFVDKRDTVRYFNQAKERIFPRTKAVIGRTVQLCHPQKSVHVVNRIAEDLRSGRRDAAEFWIGHQGRLIHIRYFPVRDSNGDYLGILEVTQDITDIKKLEGEKRLLDDARA